MREPCADLHTHSTCSDGTQTPEEVVAAADFSGVAWLSLTDHDTVDGIQRAREAIRARDLPVELITGAELSCHSDADGEVHVLAYGFDETDPTVLAHMQDFREQRHVRLARMLELLRDLGCPLETEDVLAFCRGESVSRVHVASALARHGYVANPAEAFRLYLANGAPAYVPRKKYSPETMIPMIHQWGGVAILAHPHYFDASEADDAGVEARLERYVELGIDGFEAWHPHVDKRLKRTVRRLARRHGLVLSGGSDSHGSWGNRPRVGGCTVGYVYVYELLDRIASSRGRMTGRETTAPGGCPV